MRALFLLGLGTVCGVIATVFFLGVEPDLRGASSNDAVGPGNASTGLSDAALTALMQREVAASGVLPQSTTTQVKVLEDGLVEVRMGLGTGPLRFEGWVKLDPHVTDGRLQMDVVDTFLGDVVAPTAIQGLMEEPLRRRMESVADGLAYELTGIRTEEGRLTLELTVGG